MKTFFVYAHSENKSETRERKSYSKVTNRKLYEYFLRTLIISSLLMRYLCCLSPAATVAEDNFVHSIKGAGQTNKSRMECD